MGEKFCHLSMEKRYKLEIMLSEKYKVDYIAQKLGVHRSTIYREKKRATYMHRNSDWTEEERYAPETAHKKYRERLKEKGKELKIGKNIEYANFIENKIVNEKYSPAAALMEAEKRNFGIRIGVSTLYSYIDKDIFYKLTNKNLPVKSKKKGKRKYNKVHKRKAAGTSIEERPKEIETREEFGHWEMDTVVGAQGKSKESFLVLTERKTRNEIVAVLKRHTTEQVVKALNRMEKRIGTENFRKIFKTITVDNGTEFSDADGMEKVRRSMQSRTKVYYCHPYSSGERGSNENNNRLIRRHIKKGENFDGITKNQVRKLQDWINTYPRRLLNKRSSSELFEEELDKMRDELSDLDKIKAEFLPRKDKEA